MTIPLTARVPIDFTPMALAKRTPRVTFKIRVPTPYERDAFAAELVRGGVVHYSRTQIRDLMLAGVAFLFPNDQFDQIRGELEELWQAGDAQQKCNQKRAERYVELLERQVSLPDDKKMTDEEMEADLQQIQPEVQIPETQRVRVTAIQQDVTSRYHPLQKAFADLAEQDIRRSWVCVESYVNGWDGLEFKPAGNGRGGITRTEAEWLRSHIGKEAFDQLGDFIFAMQSIDEDEEKNLALLIASTSAPIGSELAESMSEASRAGSSTDEPSTPIPDDASAKTTESSSSSSSKRGTKTGKSASTPTAAL